MGDTLNANNESVKRIRELDSVCEGDYHDAMQKRACPILLSDDAYNNVKVCVQINMAMPFVCGLQALIEKCVGHRCTEQLLHGWGVISRHDLQRNQSAARVGDAHGRSHREG